MHIWYSKEDFKMFGNSTIYLGKDGTEIIGTAAMNYFDTTAYSWPDKEYLGEGEFLRFGDRGTVSDYVEKIYRKG